MVAHQRTPHGKATRGCRSGAPSTPLHEFGGLPATRTLNASDSFRKTWARCSDIHGVQLPGNLGVRMHVACVGPVLPRPGACVPGKMCAAQECVRHRVRGASGLGRRAARNPGSGTVQPLRRNRAWAMAATVLPGFVRDHEGTRGREANSRWQRRHDRACVRVTIDRIVVLLIPVTSTYCIADASFIPINGEAPPSLWKRPPPRGVPLYVRITEAPGRGGGR